MKHPKTADTVELLASAVTTTSRSTSAQLRSPVAEFLRGPGPLETPESALAMLRRAWEDER